MATRTTKKARTNVSISEAQTSATIYAKAILKKDTITAKMNEELEKVRQKYQPEITELEESLVEPIEILNVYAIEQRKEWDGKSTELGGCVIGFRTNPPSVSKAKGITWDYLVGLMKTNKALKFFVKVKEDIDKSAILKSQNDTKVMAQLEKIGVTIDQDENFYVDVKKENV